MVARNLKFKAFGESPADNGAGKRGKRIGETKNVRGRTAAGPGEQKYTLVNLKFRYRGRLCAPSSSPFNPCEIVQSVQLENRLI